MRSMRGWWSAIKHACSVPSRRKHPPRLPRGRSGRCRRSRVAGNPAGCARRGARGPCPGYSGPGPPHGRRGLVRRLVLAAGLCGLWRCLPMRRPGLRRTRASDCRRAANIPKIWSSLRHVRTGGPDGWDAATQRHRSAATRRGTWPGATEQDGLTGRFNARIRSQRQSRRRKCPFEGWLGISTKADPIRSWLPPMGMILSGSTGGVLGRDRSHEIEYHAAVCESPVGLRGPSALMTVGLIQRVPLVVAPSPRVGNAAPSGVVQHDARFRDLIQHTLVVEAVTPHRLLKHPHVECQVVDADDRRRANRAEESLVVIGPRSGSQGLEPGSGQTVNLRGAGRDVSLWHDRHVHHRSTRCVDNGEIDNLGVLMEPSGLRVKNQDVTAPDQVAPHEPKSLPDGS